MPRVAALKSCLWSAYECPALLYLSSFSAVSKKFELDTVGLRTTQRKMQHAASAALHPGVSMKVAAVVALGILVVTVSADARPRHRNSVSPICDNNGHCTTLAAPIATPMGETPRVREFKFETSRRRTYRAVDANGNTTMVTVKTAYGFTIIVHPAYAGKFQKFFALLKEHNYKVPASITRCWAPHGTHIAGSNHYIGAACDIQTGWNRGPAFVYHMKDLIRQAGLYDGCAFHDCGHVEAVRGTHNRAPNLYAAMEKFKADQSTANYQP
jgi:hypothetical protein